MRSLNGISDIARPKPMVKRSGRLSGSVCSFQEQIACLPLERLTDVAQHLDSLDDTAARARQKKLLSEYSLVLPDLLGHLLSARREHHERRLFMQGVRLRPEQPFVDQRVDERLQSLSTLRTGSSQVRHRPRARARQRSQQRAAWPRQLSRVDTSLPRSPSAADITRRLHRTALPAPVVRTRVGRQPSPPLLACGFRMARHSAVPTSRLTSYCQLDKNGDTCAPAVDTRVSLAAIATCSTRRASVLHRGPAELVTARIWHTPCLSAPPRRSAT